MIEIQNAVVETEVYTILSASTDALEMEENETYVETTQVPTETTDNIAYEGVTSNNEETEGDILQYSNEKFNEDMPVYLKIHINNSLYSFLGFSCRRLWYFCIKHTHIELRCRYIHVL